VSDDAVDIGRHVSPILQIPATYFLGVTLGLFHRMVVVFLHEVVGQNTLKLIDQVIVAPQCLFFWTLSQSIFIFAFHLLMVGQPNGATDKPQVRPNAWGRRQPTEGV